MTTTLAVFLLLNAVWNVVVWPAFFRRIARDPRARDASGRRTRFFTVHAVLIGVSLLLAAVSLVFGLIGLFS
ncbi:SCO4848 family membrane protein [Naasia aerilata]|uniref:Integral membrane protein n=1 Tax=Naasia aerilata TaxID=1162966 RepID=A0ABM8GDW3_9MICO|nr:hypothetical protein [Naasia aerilata]BDZ46468.1 hypothetical protein GCM10025866_23770 [Naasia aerilata]